MSRKFHKSTNDTLTLETGVLHLGFGAFHRAHQAEYFDRHIERTGDTRWGITPINLRAADQAAFAQAAQQDGYILRRLNNAGEIDDRLIRCHAGFMDWSADRDATERAMAQPNVKAVTMTVTEAGYNLDGKGLLDLSDPMIRAEIDGKTGQTVYAFLTQGLRQRAALLDQPITLLNCDNIRRNGKMLSRNLLAYLEALGDTDLVSWVEQNVTFPSSMVDRITPQPSPTHHAEAQALYGEGHKLGPTIHAEDFIQWVIEDNFATDFPDLRPEDVTYTPDVDPYEETKIRVLNGGHTALAYIGALGGFERFDEVMAHPEAANHFQRFEKEEVMRALPASLPFDVETYVQTVSNRFCNEHIADSVERIVSDGYAKFPQFIRPTIRGCLEQGYIPHYSLKSIASWYHFTRKSLNGTMNVPYREPNIEALKSLVSADDPSAFTTNNQLWGDLSTLYPAFSEELNKAIKSYDLSSSSIPA